MDERADDPRARSADRMAERNGAAVDVDLLLVDAEHVDRVERDRSEGLVDLPKVDVARLKPGLLERLERSTGRCRRKVGEVIGRLRVSDDLGQRLMAVGLSPLVRGDDNRASAIVYAR